MSNKDSSKTNNTEPKFDEYRAYEELRLIFVIAIETQDFNTIESRISAWEKKYPLAEFTDTEIIRKIKAILNKDFLSRLIGDYLAAKVLHEQEKQKELYDSLKSIIDTAKKSKDYKTAQREIHKWKDNLYANGFGLYSFNKLYRARICTLLLLPSKELKNQEQAVDELKKIKENGTSMNSKDYFEAISNWQNTYSISDFPDKLKRDLNQITTEVFDSIAQKRTAENAILEIENVLSSKDIALPVDAISSILSKYDYRHFDSDALARIEALSKEALSIQESVLDNGVLGEHLPTVTTVSPTEAQALSSLKNILNTTPHDMDAILNWIYTNRKISYSEFARNEIIGQFASAGYKIPSQNSYSIPDINPTYYNDLSKIDDLRKSVILNYLGIISQGNKLSVEGKDNLIDAHAISSNEVLAQDTPKPTMFLEAFDTVLEQPEAEEEQLYDEKGEISEDKGEELIYNIFIEDIIDNPLATYSFSQALTTDKEITSNSSVAKPYEAQDKSVEEITETTVSSNLQESEINDDVTKEHEIEQPTSSADSNPKYSLTLQDEENLEKAQELSTYVLVATPILEQALELKSKGTRKKGKISEKIKDL